MSKQNAFVNITCNSVSKIIAQLNDRAVRAYKDMRHLVRQANALLPVTEPIAYQKHKLVEKVRNKRSTIITSAVFNTTEVHATTEKVTNLKPAHLSLIHI